MRKIWLIARREYTYNFKRRSFLFSAFGVPLFSLVMLFIIFNISDTAYSETGQLGDVGYVDVPGILEAGAEKPKEYVPFADEQAAHAALLNGSIGAYFVIRNDFFNAGQVDAYVPESLPLGIQRQFEEFVKANLLLRVPPGVPLERIRDPMNMTVVNLSSGNEMDSKSAFLMQFLVPFIFGFIFLMAVSTTSQFLMSGVVEEKENRMMEILITSCRPLEMLWGKVLGLGALGLTQLLIWGVGGILILNLSGDHELLRNFSIDPGFLVVALIYFTLGYFLFGAIMAGIGASVSAEQESRQIAGIFTMISILPMMLLITFMQDPNGVAPVLFSLFPITAPMAMIMRLPLADVPVWQIGLSLTLLILTSVAAIWLAARIFRIGLLMYGKRLTLRELMAVVRGQTRTMLTTAQEEH